MAQRYFRSIDPKGPDKSASYPNIRVRVMKWVPRLRTRCLRRRRRSMIPLAKLVPRSRRHVDRMRAGLVGDRRRRGTRDFGTAHAEETEWMNDGDTSLHGIVLLGHRFWVSPSYLVRGARKKRHTLAYNCCDS